ncbi:6847_t:CDS:2, partial [Funneliformis mosseae]
QGINNRIKGHSKRGMKKIRAQHRNYGNVAIVNEFNTSKICPYCFSKVVLHHACRNINGKERTVRLHGAVECVHPRCPARKLNYTTRGRDANASANIALSGASIILAADRRPLPPFRRNSSNQTRYNLVKELSLVATPELVPRDFIRFFTVIVSKDSKTSEIDSSGDISGVDGGTVTVLFDNFDSPIVLSTVNALPHPGYPIAESYPIASYPIAERSESNPESYPIAERSDCRYPDSNTKQTASYPIAERTC